MNKFLSSLPFLVFLFITSVSSGDDLAEVTLRGKFITVQDGPSIRFYVMVNKEKHPIVVPISKLKEVIPYSENNLSVIVTARYTMTYPILESIKLLYVQGEGK